MFDARASAYAAARPGYPRELFDAIAAHSRRREVAWDAASGSAQAARDLGRHFEKVIASDASGAQLAHASGRGVLRLVAHAERSALRESSVDLVTIAQALHWVDHDRFYAEVRRVVRVPGLLAAWMYGSVEVGEEEDAILRELEFGVLAGFWDERRRHVDAGYTTIAFPFPRISLPPFEIRVEMTLAQLGEYLSSWSAVGTFRAATGRDPIPPVLDRLRPLWAEKGPRMVRWPLTVLLGRIE